jgi:hypothetical protein
MARQARQWPYADAARLGAIGHSAGAQNLLLWIGAAKCPARAIVSLDTTIEYSAGNYQLHKWVRDAMRKLRRPRIPLLLFAQARLRPDFSPFDRYLSHAPHYEAQAAELSHADFVAHGYLGRTLMGMPNAAEVRRSYEEVCRAIRAFLDASLKAEGRPAGWIEQFAPSSPVSIRYKPAY